VIVRISSIAIPNERIDNYLEHVQRDLIPRYEIAPGLESVWLLQRSLISYAEVITISVWHSEVALASFFENWPFDDAGHEYAGIEFEPRTFVLLTARPREHRE
jgi:heme-degrading monooxygenase HmoA